MLARELEVRMGNFGGLLASGRPEEEVKIAAINGVLSIVEHHDGIHDTAALAMGDGVGESAFARVLSVFCWTHRPA